MKTNYELRQWLVTRSKTLVSEAQEAHKKGEMDKAIELLVKAHDTLDIHNELVEKGMI